MRKNKYMKKYRLRINCPAFEDIEVEAKNKEEAIEIAENQFQCNHSGGEFCEFIKK